MNKEQKQIGDVMKIQALRKRGLELREEVSPREMVGSITVKGRRVSGNYNYENWVEIAPGQFKLQISRSDHDAGFYRHPHNNI